MLVLLQLHHFVKISEGVGMCRTEAKVHWSPDALIRCLCEAAGHSQTLFPLPACTRLEEQRTMCRALGWECSLAILQDATASNRHKLCAVCAAPPA